uniref:Robl_LC7 domain-containing protein n=1 Tax=Globodera pallida TaxID=36090 RepID=A0A183CQG9_GLOPA
MIGSFIRNFLNGQHIIHKIRHVQTVRLTFLHQCIKNECPPAAVFSFGARMASSSSSSNRPSHRSKLLNDYLNNRAANLQLTDLGKHIVAFALDPRGSRFQIRQVQTVRLTFLHQCIKNECPPAAVLSFGARAASSSSDHPSHRSKLLNDYLNNRAANLQLTDLGKHVVEFALDPRGS